MQAANEIGPDTLAIPVNVTNLADIERLYQTVQERFDRIDVIFANAGLASFFPAGMATEQNYGELMDTNVRGIYFTIQQALPLLS